MSCLSGASGKYVRTRLSTIYEEDECDQAKDMRIEKEDLGHISMTTPPQGLSSQSNQAITSRKNIIGHLLNARIKRVLLRKDEQQYCIERTRDEGYIKDLEHSRCPLCSNLIGEETDQHLLRCVFAHEEFFRLQDAESRPGFRNN